MDYGGVVTCVADLKPSVVHRVIQVKILRQFNKTFDFVPIVEAIIVDKEGDRIHAKIDEDSFDEWSIVSARGNWIQISNFKISQVVKRFRPTLHDYQIRCNGTTKFQNIPSYGGGRFYAFVSFENILGGLVDTTYCVDVIARIVNVKESPYVQQQGERRNRVFIDLEDEEGLHLRCILMDGYYRDFVTALRELASKNDTIGILTMQFAKLDIHKGEFLLRHTKNCTVVEVNRQCSEVARMRNIFANRDRET